MKSHLKKIGSLLALGFLALGAHAAAFTPGNIAVLRVGDGSTAQTVTYSTNVFILEYTTAGSLVQTIAIPTSGGSVMSCLGNATTEGFLARSTNGGVITFAGYAVPPGITNVVGSNSVAVPRCIGVVDANGNFSRVGTGSTMYSGGNPRSAVSDGNSIWTSGSTGGIWYSPGGATPAQIGNESSSSGNLRVAKIFNGKLYYSSGSTTNGVFVLTNGLPTSATNAWAVALPSGGSPYDFAFSPAGNVAYLVDDGALTGTGGIQKWTFNGSVWAKSFTFGSANALTAGCRSITVDFSGANPVIYANDTSSPTKLITITDTSLFSDTSDTTDQATVIATAPANTFFRGVALAPVPAAPLIASQPGDTNILAGSSVSLTVNAYGTAPLAYQWYHPNLSTPLSNGASGFGGTISGSTNSVLTLTAVDPAQVGSYQVIITNSTGSVTSRVAQLNVTTVAVPPTITNQPVSLTVNAGDPAAFTVVVGGTTPLSYQWKVDNGTITNLVAGTNYVGTNSATLSIPAATVGLTGLKYFCTITNVAGVTNTAKATLTVNAPQTLTVAQFRAKVDGSFAPTNTTTSYTITGIVTTFANMTSSSTSTEFFIQDNTGGIPVFWSGAAPGANLPPAGALVQVTGPMAAFNGLLEIEPVVGNPVHSVVIISTNNPLPAAQPLPMDPNLTFAQVKSGMEASYFVASNVMLAAGSTFGSGVSEFITNNVTHSGLMAGVPAITFTNHQGDVFTLYINSFGTIAGMPKPSGPVTIYGVLNFSSLNTGSQGFELTPSRYEEIVSYVHITNVLTNARKGDSPTNSYTELVLRPGEKLTTHVSIGDAEGGVVTLTPITTGLSANSGWSGLTSGLTATGVFTFSPTQADAGSNYLVNVAVSSTAGTLNTMSFTVYVPTADEQKVVITEFLANPTTNTSAAHFNPLARATDTTGVSTNDQYIEVANLSGSDLAAGWSLDYGNKSKLLFDSFAVGAGVSVPSASSVVVYGGGSQTPGLTSPNYASTLPAGLGLNVTGSSYIILRNGNNGGSGGGNIIDRVVYSASNYSTNGSLARFPTINDAFVPQTYVSTNHVTPGAQYNGGSWATATSVPQGVSPVSVSVSNNQVFLNFTAVTTKASTLWRADNVTDPFTVVNGGQFASPAATFAETNLTSQRFYFITTQQ